MSDKPGGFNIKKRPARALKIRARFFYVLTFIL